MPNAAISVLGVSGIKADAREGCLFLSVQSKDGGEGEFFTFSLGRQGLALRLAGAINAVQQEDSTPIYPAADRRVA